MKQHRMVSARAIFTHELVGDAIVVIDQHDERRPSMSVTNDIEHVIEVLSDAYPEIDIDRALVVYLDTQGAWDGVAIKDRRFQEFVLLGAKSERHAVEALKKWRALYGAPAHG